MDQPVRSLKRLNPLVVEELPHPRMVVLLQVGELTGLQAIRQPPVQGLVGDLLVRRTRSPGKDALGEIHNHILRVPATLLTGLTLMSTEP